jgi:hypothetical protein
LEGLPGDQANSAEAEYSTSKKPLSKDYKPLTGDSLLAKLSRNVAEKMEKEYNPEVLMQVTLAAFDELKTNDFPKLVADVRPVLRISSQGN